MFEDHDTPIIVVDKENILNQQETQQNTMTDVLQQQISTAGTPAPSVEIITDEKQTAENLIDNDLANKKNNTSNVNADLLSTELNDLNSKNNTISEIIQSKEVSPKKTVPKFTPLVSSMNSKIIHRVLCYSSTTRYFMYIAYFIF